MSSLAELTTRYEHEKEAYLLKVGNAQASAEQVTRLTEQVRERQERQVTYAQVAEVFKTYAEAEHDALRGRIETLVTHGLRTVFDEDMAFKLTPGHERGQATIRFTIVTPEAGETDLAEARGGGLVSIVGFLLRLTLIVLDPSGARRFLMLDETFGMLSEQYQEPMSRLLRQLVDEAGLQVVLVTHQDEIAAHADLVYRFEHDGKQTVVRRLGEGD